METNNLELIEMNPLNLSQSAWTLSFKEDPNIATSRTMSRNMSVKSVPDPILRLLVVVRPNKRPSKSKSVNNVQLIHQIVDLVTYFLNDGCGWNIVNANLSVIQFDFARRYSSVTLVLTFGRVKEGKTSWGVIAPSRLQESKPTWCISVWPRALVESSWKARNRFSFSLSTATSSASITSSLAPPAKFTEVILRLIASKRYTSPKRIWYKNFTILYDVCILESIKGFFDQLLLMVKSNVPKSSVWPEYEWYISASILALCKSCMLPENGWKALILRNPVPEIKQSVRNKIVGQRVRNAILLCRNDKSPAAACLTISTTSGYATVLSSPGSNAHYKTSEDAAFCPYRTRMELPLAAI